MKKTAHDVFVTSEREHAVLTVNAAWKLLIQSLSSVSTSWHSLGKHVFPSFFTINTTISVFLDVVICHKKELYFTPVNVFVLRQCKANCSAKGGGGCLLIAF